MAIITLTSIQDINPKTKLFEITAIGLYQIQLDLNKSYKFVVSNIKTNVTSSGGEGVLQPPATGTYTIGEKLSSSDEISYRVTDNLDLIRDSSYLIINATVLKLSPLQIRLITLN